NSRVTDNQSRLLGGSPRTPGSRTVNHVYWEVLQELLGHGRSILSTRKFSRNSWVMDNQSRLLESSPGTPGSRTTNHVYWEVLQELPGHGRSISSTGKLLRLWQVYQIVQVVKPVRPDIVSQETSVLLNERIITN
ncbi:hypothetical protein V8G54_010551, partial [Vigna mungo]